MNEEDAEFAIERLERDYGKQLMATLESADIDAFFSSCSLIYMKMRGRVTVQEMLNMGLIDMNEPNTNQKVTEFLKETSSLDLLIPTTMREDIRKEIIGQV